MTGPLNVPVRLVDGLAAVATAQVYVSACELLGYQHPDLTRHTDQLRDWYGSEDGLDLDALAADCAALRSAAGAAAEVLALQNSQTAAVHAAWQGRGGQAAGEFLRRHSDAAARATTALGTSAEALTELREQLWRLVDRKVTATQAIDGGGRSDWLAAARTVATGLGNRSVASELVDAEVRPFVDSVIRVDWLGVLKETLTSITASFEAAVATLTDAAGTGFASPTDLGPRWTPLADLRSTDSPQPSESGSGGGRLASSTAPAPGPVLVGPGPTPPDPVPPAGVVAAAPAASPWSGLAPGSTPPAPVPTEPAMAAELTPVPPPSGGLGGGALPDLSSGFSAVGRQLADMLGGLFSGDIGVLDEPVGTEPLGDHSDGPTLDDDQPDDEDTEPDDEDGKGEDGEGEEDEGEDESAEDESAEDDEADVPAGEVGVSGTAAAEPQPLAATPPLEPVATPPPAAVPAPAAPVVAPQTPCEIAADELPQVGE